MRYSPGTSTWIWNIIRNLAPICWSVSSSYPHILLDVDMMFTLVLRVHWLWVKATKDWWIEEEELLHSEFEWTISFFKHHMEQWRERVIRS